MNVFESLFRLSSRALESGLAGMDAALSTAQKSLGGWTGQPPATARNRPGRSPTPITLNTSSAVRRSSQGPLASPAATIERRNGSP